MTNPEVSNDQPITPTKKEVPTPDPVKLKSEMLLNLSTAWSKLSLDERRVLTGIAGCQTSQGDNDLISISNALTHRPECFALYREVIPPLIKRHPLLSTSNDQQKKGESKKDEKAEEKSDDWRSILLDVALILIPLLVFLWHRNSPVEDKPEQKNKKEQDDEDEQVAWEESERTILKRERLQRKLAKKTSKAARVQRYIQRRKQQDRLQTSELRQNFEEIDQIYRVEKKLQEKLDSPRFPAEKKARFVQGTSAYERQKARLDAELDEYFANPDVTSIAEKLKQRQERFANVSSDQQFIGLCQRFASQSPANYCGGNILLDDDCGCFICERCEHTYYEARGCPTESHWH